MKRKKTTAAAKKPQAVKPATPAPVIATPPAPTPKRRRRRRRPKSQLLSQRLIIEVQRKKRQFLREVSQLLTDALGFEVRVTLVAQKVDMTPDMRRARRMTKAQAREQIRQSAGSLYAPSTPKPKDIPLRGDDLPI